MGLLVRNFPCYFATFFFVKGQMGVSSKYRQRAGSGRGRV